jgi:hypothetical protein
MNPEMNERILTILISWKLKGIYEKLKVHKYMKRAKGSSI